MTLDEAYQACRAINAYHGRTYFLATRLLPAASRPSVHALYAFARLADEIVDNGAAPGDPGEALNSLEKALAEALSGGPYAHPVLLALADTVRRHDLDEHLFTAFLASMRMDLTVTGYATFADLAEYTHGSAGVIGLQMLPVLGTSVPRDEAAPYAAALGEAFQLTNFLRDVGEDLDRGRLYLPADELAAFGVDRAMLEHAHRTGRTERPIRRALAHLVSCNHAVYRRAEPGIGMLAPRARPCIAAATAMYRRILDEIADADYDVLTRRVVVPTRRRLRIAATALVSALPFGVVGGSR
ncbi:phytoene/squalene synthase family protein [Actinophytocola sp. KF-1]